MNSRSKKIFWGLLIASLHIDLFGLVLLPACFGFAILYFGIYDLEKGGASFPLTQRQMKFYHALAAALGKKTFSGGTEEGVCRCNGTGAHRILGQPFRGFSRLADFQFRNYPDMPRDGADRCIQ